MDIGEHRSPVDQQMQKIERQHRIEHTLRLAQTIRPGDPELGVVTLVGSRLLLCDRNHRLRTIGRDDAGDVWRKPKGSGASPTAELVDAVSASLPSAPLAVSLSSRGHYPWLDNEVGQADLKDVQREIWSLLATAP